VTPLTVVCWRWKPDPGYRSAFRPSTVRALRDMVRRHYPKPHRFLCVTDDPKGMDSDIETVPLWKDFAAVPSPHGRRNPSCYRRLKAFAPEIAEIFGPRFISIDLDTVITGDLTPIFERPEDFIIWGETDPRSFYNGSLFMMTAGARKHVLEQFDPKHSPRLAKAAGKFGSDQGWISYCLGPGEATWGRQDGVYSYRVHIQPQGGKLPENAKIVCFHGGQDPWGHQAQKLPWVREFWGMPS